MLSKNENHTNVCIFSDFDATISQKDIGDLLFLTFGEWDNLYAKFIDGFINIRELNIKLCKSLNPNISLEEINKWAITKEIDNYFMKFIEYCKENNYNFTIVSDGYDAYIKPILNNNNFPDYPVYCNSLVFNGKNYEPKFFGAVENCHCTTASCKRNVLLNNSNDDDIIVFIGDGHTDFCCAEYADIVFAKLKLAAYCNEKRIPHYPYKTFFDVMRILENCKKNNKLRHRHQAKMKRKTAFENE